MKRLLIFVFIVINACSANKTVVEQTKKEDHQQNIKIELSKEENFKFLIKNTSDRSVYLYQPSRLVIEKYTDQKWKSVKILHCPCDAPCQPPQEKYLLERDSSYTLRWNKMLSWCGKRKEAMVRETITEPAKKGKYRLVIRLHDEGKVGQTIYKEFRIK